MEYLLCAKHCANFFTLNTQCNILHMNELIQKDAIVNPRSMHQDTGLSLQQVPPLGKTGTILTRISSGQFS
jgi:hypothetical protein